MLLHLEIIKVIFSLTGFFLCPPLLLLLLHVCVQTSSLTGCLSLFDCLLLFFIQSGSFGVYLGTTPRLFYESLFFSMSFCICLATTLHCLCVFSFFLCPFTVYHLIISVISYVCKCIWLQVCIVTLFLVILLLSVISYYLLSYSFLLLCIFHNVCMSYKLGRLWFKYIFHIVKRP